MVVRLLHGLAKFALIFGALFLAVRIHVASAATVTLNEAALDQIYSQTSFGNTPIDIRFDSTQTLVAPSLLDINSSNSVELGQLAPPTSGPIIDMAFIDSFDGNPNSGVVGLAWVGAPGIAVNSTFAADPTYGPSLMAHEIGHNLGLDHVTDSADLMYPTDLGQTLLTTDQVSTILASSLVQHDSGGLYLEIQPILVVASAIATTPLPSSALLFLSGIGVFVIFRRKQQRCDTETV